MPFDLSQVFATLSGLLTRQPFAVGGSGSSYVYGFVDAEFRGGMSKEECQQFVVNSTLVFSTQRFFFSSDGSFECERDTRHLLPTDCLFYLCEVTHVV